ncbi:MAG: FAD-binding oxidoreductase [Henriciella sp.]|uniref:FAD-binding oxidoreductase n=1 Tax=Henriciella sp. TaxID=1968823 RepID=UPI003C74E316
MSGDERICGWGRHPVVRAPLERPSDLRAVLESVQSRPGVIARGNGRSYGDSSFNSAGAMSMLRFDHMLDFDPASGQITCEAGVILGDVIKAVLPLGWFPPVTPGTKFVTIGGMIAANVHGKNSVKDGAFADYVEWLDLMTAGGEIVRCSPEERQDLFLATVGGMGLTGIIVRACFRLKQVESAWIQQTRIAAPDLDSLMQAFDAHEDATYRVAWIDVLQKGKGLGRGLLDVAEHAKLDALSPKQREDPFATRERRKKSVPFTLPLSPLNGLTVRAFNAMHYRLGRMGAGERLVDWDSYFYPLDTLLHWNRIYGQKGFAQYQCVLPMDSSRAALGELLSTIANANNGSFLAVLKQLGDTIGTLSFPMRGYTLALDFPWSRRTAELLEKLDEIVIRHQGRIYLAKDSRISASSFKAMQKSAATMTDFREKSGAASAFASLQSERLAL